MQRHFSIAALYRVQLKGTCVSLTYIDSSNYSVVSSKVWIIFLHLLFPRDLKGPFITQSQLVAAMIFWYCHVQQPALLKGWGWGPFPLISFLFSNSAHFTTGFLSSWIETPCPPTSTSWWCFSHVRNCYWRFNFTIFFLFFIALQRTFMFE